MDFFRPENFYQAFIFHPKNGHFALFVRRARTHMRAVAAFFPPSFPSMFGASWRYSQGNAPCEAQKNLYNS